MSSLWDSVNQQRLEAWERRLLDPDRETAILAEKKGPQHIDTGNSLRDREESAARTAK